MTTSELRHVGGETLARRVLAPVTFTMLRFTSRHSKFSAPVPIVFGAFLCSTITLTAQSQTPFAKVNVLNTTTHAGTDVADVVLPIAEGRLRSVPRLITDQGHHCAVRAFGARWDDGSYRYLAVNMPVDVGPGQTSTIDLTTTGTTPPAFAMHPAIVRKLLDIRLSMRFGSSHVGFSDPVLLNQNHLVELFRRQLRVPGSSMWAELWVLVYRNQPHARFYLQWGNSNPLTTTLGEDPGKVQFEFIGMDASFQNPGKILDSSPLPGGGTRVLLHGGGMIGDGQAQSMEGQFLFSGAAPRVRAMAQGWAGSGAFGPFGEIFPQIEVSTATWNQMLADDVRTEIAHPWAPSVHGCNPQPSNTGAQADFGIVAMRPDVLRADPARLSMIARSTQQEWCRSTHFKELDLSPVTVANHPKWIQFGGRPHFRGGAWVDCLGKPPRPPLPSEQATDPLDRPFVGHDAEHWSVNYLCAFALTTGDPIAVKQCNHQVELWLARYTRDSGSYTDQPAAARAEGRGLLAGCWLWLVTGRKDLEDRLIHRSKLLLPEVTGPETGPPGKLPGVLEPRWSAAEGHYWPPWEEALAAAGAAAVATLFDVPEARVVADVISTTVVRHGIGYTHKGWRVGYWLPFTQFGELPYYALLDRDFEAKRSAGPGLTIWTLSAVVQAALGSKDRFAHDMAVVVLVELLTDPLTWKEGRVADWITVVPHAGK